MEQVGRKIPKILSIGAATYDVFLGNSPAFKAVRVDGTHDVTELELGAKIDVNKVDFATGGGATNASVTFSRQGLEASFFGYVGDDLAGHAAINSLDDENVDTSRVVVSDQYNTDYSTVILAPNGERTILTYRGASSHIDVDNFELKPNEFDWIYISNLSGNMNSLHKIFTEAKKNNIKIMWNPGKKELDQTEKMKTLLGDIEVLLVNKEEARMAFSGETAEELVIRATELVPIVIITDGADGVYASDGEKIVRAGIYEDVKAIDRTGAGDAFGSGFLSQWSQGAELAESLLFASANSTSAITFVGAKAGLLKVGAELHAMPMSEKKIR